MIAGEKCIGTVGYLGGLPAVLETWAWDWSQMVAYNARFFGPPNGYVHYCRAPVSDHGPARNMIVREFLGDWLVQLDTDHTFDPDVVARLVRSADANGLDVLSGFYQFKSAPHTPVLFQWVETGFQPLASWPEECKILQVGSAGAGCLFVRRKVFDRIASELREEPFDRRPRYSEDHSFFLRCRELKIKCWVDFRIRCDHLRFKAITPDDMDRTAMRQSELFAVGGYRG